MDGASMDSTKSATSNSQDTSAAALATRLNLEEVVLGEMLDNAYSSGYDDGFEDGFNKGYDQGIVKRARHEIAKRRKLVHDDTQE